MGPRLKGGGALRGGGRLSKGSYSVFKGVSEKIMHASNSLVDKRDWGLILSCTVD